MSINITTLLLEDKRFISRSTKFAKSCSDLNTLISKDEIRSELESNFTSQKHFIHLLNILQYAEVVHDSFAYSSFTADSLLKILTDGVEGNIDYTYISEFELKDKLKSDYVDYKRVLFNLGDPSSNGDSITAKFFKREKEKNINSKNASPKVIEFDESYWERSVDLDWPTFPILDNSNILYSIKLNGEEYNIPSDKIIPFDQSQITCSTDYHKFSKTEILNLFPPLRIYTRDKMMYRKYENSYIEYDEDLGVIFPIGNYTFDQIKENIIEYPHFNVPDRIVTDKKLDKEVLRDFWKDIEIDGEMYPTHKVWEELEDTKNLPKHPTFMNEYVVRKYILDSTIGHVNHKYKMRGQIEPFLTLYCDSNYYKDKGYDPIDIGTQCIKSRQKYKFTRNPIIRLMQSEGLNLEQLERLSI